MNIIEIISKYLLSKENKQELDQLNVWKDDTEHNIEVINQLDDVWVASGELKDYQDFDTDTAWNTLEATHSSPQAKSQSRQSSRYLMAACAIVLVGLAYWTIALNNSESTMTQMRDFATHSSELKTFKLADNTHIWLNTSSSLSQTSDFHQERSVSLDGQAYFDVARDTQRPFIITTTNETVTVLGTAFDLNSANGIFDLKVTEGLVAVNTGNRTIEVSANKRLVKKKGDYILLNHFDKNTLEWRFDNLSFDNTPLGDVLMALSQTYQVTFDNAKGIDLNKCLINTKFEDESLEDILDELTIITHLKLSQKGANNYQILSVNCN